jgi:hypothetical protein
MNNSMKLIAGTVLTLGFLAGCTGSNLPTATAGGGQPGFSGRVTKNNLGVADKTVWLKKYTGKEGSLEGGSAVTGTGVKTDSNGQYFIPAPADAVSGGALFGVAYDATNTQFNGNATAGDAGTNKDEVQWFSTPAVDLSTKSGKTANVSFDIGWASTGFTPAYGSVVSAPNVSFSLPTKEGATQYEVRIVTGKVIGSGSTVKTVSSATATGLTWEGATPGDYHYQAKVLLPAGIAGVTGSNQAASPELIFSVRAAGN